MLTRLPVCDIIIALKKDSREFLNRTCLNGMGRDNMLSKDLLMPSSSGTRNPFSSMLTAIESHLGAEYRDAEWNEVKRTFLLRILRLKKNGQAINRLAFSAPNDGVSTLILEAYQVLDRSVYFTSQFWRAFYHWLDKGNVDAERWPLFGYPEACLAISLLKPAELVSLKASARMEWPNIFDRPKEVDQLFTDVQTTVKGLCRRRLTYLSRRDPAIHSLPDLVQQVNSEVLYGLRTNDHFADSPHKMFRWAIKCADNYILNLQAKAKTLKSGPDAEHVPVDEDVAEKLSTIRMMEDIEDRLCLNGMLKAEGKVGIYMTTLFGGKHNPEFWEWFRRNEPTLASREVYVEEHPEAIGPWVQRWLKLPTSELLVFLREAIPTFRHERGTNDRLYT